MKLVFGWLRKRLCCSAMISSKGGNLSGGADAPRPQPELEPALVEAVVGLPELRRVGRVDEHRDPEFACLVPERRQARVVDRDTVAAGVPVGHAEALEDLEAGGAVAHIRFQLRGRPLAPAGLAHAPEHRVGEEDEAPRVAPGHLLEPRRELVATAPRQVDHDRHVQLVHLGDQAVHVGGGHAGGALVAVDVDEGEPGPRDRVLGDDQGAARLVLLDGDVLGAERNGSGQGARGQRRHDLKGCGPVGTTA